jgi:hypothetical protein
MARRVLAIASFAVLACACGASEPASSRPPEGPTSEPAAPSLAELQQLLSTHEAHAFDAAALGRGCPADQSLGAYLAMLVENGSPSDRDGDLHRLEGGCTSVPRDAARAPVDPPVDPAFWDCRIEAFSSDPAGESPWHYELRFRVRRADRTVDLEHLSCPGL